MKHFLICASTINLCEITESLNNRVAALCIYEDTVIDNLSRAQHRGFNVAAVIVDSMETAKRLRRDIDDLRFDTEVIEWRGDRREFEEELGRLEL